VHGVLGPADGLALVVRAGCEAVGAAERGQRSHDTVLPDEAETLIANGGSSGKEGGTAPPLSEWVRLRGLRDPADDFPPVLDGPEDAAVRAAECAQVEDRVALPERRVLHLVAREVGNAGDPAAVVDAAARARRPAERRQIGDLVVTGRAGRRPGQTGALDAAGHQ
jgi:hypothetical protein